MAPTERGSEIWWRQRVADLTWVKRAQGTQSSELRSVRCGGKTLLKGLLVVLRLVRGEMFPEAVVAPFVFIVQAATALFLDKAFPFAGAVNHDDAQLRVNLPLSIPETAGRADLDLSRDYQFLFCSHRGGKASFNKS